MDDQYLKNKVTGALVRRWRLEAKVNMTQLAKSLGKSHSRISRLEEGDETINLDEFITLVRAIGRDPTDALRQILVEYDAARRLAKEQAHEAGQG